MDEGSRSSPVATSFLSRAEIEEVGFGAVGENCRLSRFARYYNPSRIFLGSEIRIDDFALISPGDGQIHLAGYNHIGAACTLQGEIRIGEWSTVSGRTGVFAKSDDFTVDAVTYPHADQSQRVVIQRRVRIGSRVVIGTGCTVLPGVDITDGVSVGAMSLVDRSLSQPGVYAGVPAKFRRRRAIIGVPATES